jgi:vancomycin resistance protein VanJ
MNRTQPSAPATNDLRLDSGDAAGTRRRGLRRMIRRAIRSGARPTTWRRGPVTRTTVPALLLGLLLLLHARIPNRFANLGSLVESLLPWFGLFVPLVLVVALWRRSASAMVALLLPAAVWVNLFGGLLVDKSTVGGDLTVAEQNVDAGNPDPARTAGDLAASGATLLALVELTAQETGTYEQQLATAYPYHTVQGTVGLWSKLPLSGTAPIDIVDFGPLAADKPAADKLATNRALRTTVTTAHGPLTVYVAHLGSVRVTPRTGFWTASRNIGAQALGAALAADRSQRVLLLGDLNGTADDRELGAITSHLRSAQAVAGDGFGFTWPASFPIVRIDQILVRGVTPDSSWVLPATASDHLPIAARLSW